MDGGLFTRHCDPPYTVMLTFHARWATKKISAKTGRDDLNIMQHNSPSSICEKCYYFPYLALTYTAGKVRQQLYTAFQ